MTLCPLIFKPEINRLRQTVEDYYCANFQVDPIRGFRFIVLTYKPTYPHTSSLADLRRAGGGHAPRHY